jgi:cytohesin
MLLDAGAEKNSACKNGFTPLHMAVGDAHLEVVRVLLDAGAEKNSACKNGFTPLHLAVGNAHLDESRWLLSFGVMSNRHQEVEVVRLLLKSGADANARTDAGEIALHLAIKSGCLKIVRLLLASRVDMKLTAVCCCPWYKFIEFS